MSPTSPFAEASAPRYGSLARRSAGDSFITAAAVLAEAVLHQSTHGDLPRWRKALAALPETPPRAVLHGAAPELGWPVADPAGLRDTLMALHPWRKGPLTLGGTTLDTEWRSDWKWDRVAPHLQLAGQRVLDIGCGNGYFGWRMLGGGAELVMGIDPTLVFVMQWLACRHFAGDLPNYVLPLGIEDLPPGPAAFDYVFSMGVLYHRRDPLEHLLRIRDLLRPSGTLVLETLVLPAAQRAEILHPAQRYARMRNVWAIPGTDRLAGWLRQAGYRHIERVDVTATTTDEQRSTPWMQFESLAESLHPDQPGLTREGYPAPVRALLLAAR